MQDNTDLAALIGSRICHDLISPIGAIGNGVELLTMDQAAASPELALIAESVASANARIRFFRVAFGVAGADQRIARSEVSAILAAICQGGRLKIDWSSAAEIDRRDVKLAFLLLLCLENALPYGGRIRVTQSATGWQLVAEALRLRVDAKFWDMLGEGLRASASSGPGSEMTGAQTQRTILEDGEGNPIAASHVQFALSLDTLRARGLVLERDFASEVITLEWQHHPGASGQQERG